VAIESKDVGLWKKNRIVEKSGKEKHLRVARISLPTSAHSQWWFYYIAYSIFVFIIFCHYTKTYFGMKKEQIANVSPQKWGVYELF
jgi:hypothetical protein